MFHYVKIFILVNELKYSATNLSRTKSVESSVRRDPATPVSNSGVSAHGRQQEATLVSETGAMTHERQQEEALVSKTGAMAHER